jgi:hypothetical protein
VEIQGSAIIVQGTGTVSTAYTVIGASDLEQPAASWDDLESGTINGDGSFSNAVPVTAALPVRYYRVRLP